MADPGSQASVLQRVRNKNNIADLIYKRKMLEIERETLLSMSKIEMEKLDCKSFLKSLRTCESDDMSEFAPLVSFTSGEDVESSMKGKRTRFRDLFAIKDFSDKLPVVLDYKHIKSAGEKLRYKDLSRSRTLIELWTSRVSRPEFLRSKTDMYMPVEGDTHDQSTTQEDAGNLKSGIITKIANPGGKKASAFQMLPPRRSSDVDALLTIGGTAKHATAGSHGNLTSHPTSEENMANEEKLYESLASKPKAISKPHGYNKHKELSLDGKIKTFYADIEPLIPKKEKNREKLYLPPINFEQNVGV